jgi:hypothetical protein
MVTSTSSIVLRYYPFPATRTCFFYLAARVRMVSAKIRIGREMEMVMRAAQAGQQREGADLSPCFEEKQAKRNSARGMDREQSLTVIPRLLGERPMSILIISEGEPGPE